MAVQKVGKRVVELVGNLVVEKVGLMVLSSDIKLVVWKASQMAVKSVA